MDKRKMEAMKKFLYLLVVLLLSCNNSPKEFDNIDALSNVMADYYLNHLTYPIDGEQFCYKFYRQDSISGFKFIDESMDLDEAFLKYARFAKDSHQYSGYMKTMKSLADIWINNAFADELKMLGWIFSDAESVKFEETDSLVIMFDRRKNFKLSAEKFQLWANEYKNNKSSWKEASEKFGPYKMGYVHNYYNKLNFYTQDSLFVTHNNPQILKHYSKRLYESINKHYDKSMLLQSLSYHRNNHYVNSHGDSSFIHTIEEDTVISNILDSIMLCDDRISIINFHFH